MTKLDRRVVFVFLAVVIVLSFLIFYQSYPFALQIYIDFLQKTPSKTITDFLMVIGMTAAFFLGYQVISRTISVAIIRAGGRDADVKMFMSLLRYLIISVWLLAILSLFINIGAFLTAVGAFGGLFLGWSLQQPVTGIAAWALIMLRRPFRIGDRIYLPAWGLIGDVLDIGLMYTVLNQVGGTVGTEEPSGRSILVPNAILFGNVVIDYTAGEERESTHILDEIIVRITYDSDWKEAEKILVDSAREITADIIKATQKEPYVRSDFYDYGVYLRLRYMTVAIDRPRITHEINKLIFDKVSESKRVDFAIPYVYSYKHQMKKVLSDSAQPP